MLDFPFFLSPVNSTGEAGETTDNEVLMAVLHSSPAIIQVIQLCARSGTVFKILVKLGCRFKSFVTVEWLSSIQRQTNLLKQCAFFHHTYWFATKIFLFSRRSCPACCVSTARLLPVSYWCKECVSLCQYTCLHHHSGLLFYYRWNVKMFNLKWWPSSYPNPDGWIIPDLWI